MADSIPAASLDALLVVHAAATWFMTGVIWFVQLAHYPLMALVGRENWAEYELGHRRWTSVVVMPAMLLELAAASALTWRAAQGDAAPLAIAWLGAALLALVWLSTFLVQVPLHERLRRAFDERVHARLVATNWVRTIAWSLRATAATLVLW